MSVPITVLGAGSFGTCLAVLCAADHPVRLWARSEVVANTIRNEGHNPKHLRDVMLPDSIEVTSELEEALKGAEMVIVAVPSHALREVMVRVAPVLPSDAIVVSGVKGIEIQTGMLMHQVLEELLPESCHPRITCLSGPSFAQEIAQRKPTVVTIAGRNQAYVIAVQTTLSCPWFRCYSSDDVVGVELGGALKNVIAIAVGMADGLKMGLNARAALMTRGLAEITRLAIQLGGRVETLGGLSGMGDLVLTCTGDLSRNRNLGLELGQGHQLDEIAANLGGVAEGVATTRAACRLARRLGVDLPIAECVRRVLDGEVSPERAGLALMTRQLGPENLL